MVEDPEHRMADVRLLTIECENDPPPGWRYPLEAGGISQRQGEECVVPFRQMTHSPWGNRHTALEHMLIDVGQSAMLRVRQGTDLRHDIEATLVTGLGHTALGFRAVGTEKRQRGSVETAPDLSGALRHVFQSRDCAIVMIGSPHRLGAEGVMTPEWL